MAIRLPASARREQLLATALEVFARQGFHATSMNDVAEAAGVTKPVLYQHFASKRDLYLALLDDVGGRLLGAIARATAGTTDGKLRTEQGFAGYFRWVAHDHDSFLLLFGSGARRDEEFAVAVRRVEGQIADAVAPLITADIDADHRRTIAHALVGLAEGASRELVQRGADFDPDVLARQVADLAWAGLRALRPAEN
jgi:AcrR family transcriptional regulator